LGALHGLEPGHSKTMMAAFIVAIRGTVTQAVLLGLAATVSHTAVVWVVALGGMYLWQGLDAHASEPYFQLASAVLIVGIALWMLARTWQDQQRATLEGHDHDHDHHHDDELRRIDTGHGIVTLEIFEQGAPPKWRFRRERGGHWSADEVTLETERPDGRRQTFTFADFGGYFESVEEIPEPHEFMARLRLSHGDHAHDYDAAFMEHGHGHDHLHEEVRGLDVATSGYQDAHELAHANDIRRRFADRNVTTGQIVTFGLTGGLIPCPAAVTVLLLCLQLKAFILGVALVLCFSIGLALTLVAVGATAALSVRHAERRWSWFSGFARRAPYASSLLIIAVGLYVGVQGWLSLHA
ncbi:MAG: nickel/cobalt efflux transporter RcnA, partial [Alphaproteobacteria bacterium]|nr:nickel/cobalt efflux transporter RcnA [Alphaproteobacteria bacterium]